MDNTRSTNSVKQGASSSTATNGKCRYSQQQQAPWSSGAHVSVCYIGREAHDGRVCTIVQHNHSVGKNPDCTLLSWHDSPPVCLFVSLFAFFFLFLCFFVCFLVSLFRCFFVSFFLTFFLFSFFFSSSFPGFRAFAFVSMSFFGGHFRQSTDVLSPFRRLAFTRSLGLKG